MSEDERVTRYDVDISVLTVEMKSLNDKFDRFLARYDDHEERLRKLENAEAINNRIKAVEDRLLPIERWQTAIPVSVITALVVSLTTAGIRIFELVLS